MNVGLLLVAIVFVGMVFTVFYIYSTTSPTPVYYLNTIIRKSGSNPASATTEARRKMALAPKISNGIYSKVYTNPPR